MFRTCLLPGLAALLLAASTVFGAEPRTEHTFRLAEGEQPPSATVDDVAWLAGTWHGTGFGKKIEEYWSAPSAGTMLGTFKVIDGDKVEFYELMELGVTDGRLGLKVKHFWANFEAWEDKPDFVHFKLVALEPEAAHFAGISFYRRGRDELDVYLVMRNGDEIREEKLSYTRVQ